MQKHSGTFHDGRYQCPDAFYEVLAQETWTST